MALAVSVRLDFTDNKGKTSSTKLRIPTGFSIANYIAFVQQAAQVIANMTSGRITRAGFCVGLDLSGVLLKANPTSLSDIAQKGHFQFATDATGFRTRLKVPAINEALILAGSDAIDQADAGMALFIAAMEDGISVTGGTIEPCDSRDNDIVSTDFARELFRKK